MDKMLLYEAVGNIDERYIAAAHGPAGRKKSVLLKWGALAACLVLFLGVAAFQSGLLGSRTDIAVLHTGEKIVFEKADTFGGALSLDLDMTTRQLTHEEVLKLFGEMSFTGNAVLQNGDAETAEPQRLIGYEGRVGTVKVVISAADVQLLDTVIDGVEKKTVVGGVNVAGGYFITDPNSKGEQNVIYYASFVLGDCRVYLENAGAKADRETVKNQLADTLQKLIENGEPDLWTKNQ